MYNPVTTYRIQFFKGFTFKDLEQQLDYLENLGVGTIYASPVFEAVPGSGHGYDVTDPGRINPEVGTLQGFMMLSEKLRLKQIGWLQDIVPNHMAFHPANQWIRDLLEKGVHSSYHHFFDLEPGVPGPGKPLMLPFLGSTLDEAIANKEIKLGWDNGNFAVEYFDNVFPASFESFRDVVENALVDAPILFSDHWKNHLLDTSHPSAVFLNTIWETSKGKLQHLVTSDKKSRSFIENLIQTFNDHEHLMRNVLKKQHYELCYWKDTEQRINFRRFFTINGLICLRMENAVVFERYHRFAGRLIRDGYIHGLRIDHIDGLNDPNQYLDWLRELTGKDTYIVAEKILEQDEALPAHWPVQGSTGYDFLAAVNNLFTSVKDYQKLRSLYQDVTPIADSPARLIYNNKKMILTTRMHGEWDNLLDFFDRQEFVNYLESEEVSREEMKEAIGGFMLACPVYRLYPRQFPLRNQNRRLVQEILETALHRNPALKKALDRLGDILLREDGNEDHNERVKAFFARLMQYTGPLMAKGVEDTSMYQYNCFIAHNEVGDAINAQGITTAEYHRQMLERQQQWPLAMNTTSTHDTKRGEDVRARLNVISEQTGDWETHVRRWMEMNQKLKTRLESGILEPSLSVEYFIYQTLLGTFPFDGRADETYLKRIDQYLVKALREAKRKVSWSEPDEAYENTVCEFARKILDPGHTFLESFVSFHQKVVWPGVVNSLSQLALKCTSPGLPDIYQGTELWELTLVDPDNRQAVDYSLRHELLSEMQARFQKEPSVMIRELMRKAFDGRIKLWMTHRLLQARRKNPDLFSLGRYLPLEVQGKFRNNILAFARNNGNDWFITVVPLLTTQLHSDLQSEYVSKIPWEDTRLLLPEKAPVQWTNILSGRVLEVNGELPVGALFTDAATGLLEGRSMHD
jgi:malto-oligosyltrehalose synthase